MNRIRRALQPTLSVVGMLVVFGGVLLIPPTNLRLTVIVVMAGVVILEAGVWGLANRVLPSTRRYLALRAEVEDFIRLVPDLNSAALARDSGAEGGELWYQETMSLMRESVEKMGEAAGREG